ncbi:hypothetical protein [Mucisphaera calidilacus]|uniref:Uncharacterized protein n=1 Tax=Mucisphaera calidilacus TaxID=2527982 RepID=A0A518C0D8_9BACT|nr:hypothetical protein [Mucisphaera calidilacus]QDU72686.1 hypothetical protein Pan265_25600 [Mucisphaera calidilacus]
MESNATTAPKEEQYELGISVSNLILIVAMAFPILVAIVMLTVAGYRYTFGIEVERKQLNRPHAAVSPVEPDRTEKDLRNEQLSNIGAGSAAESAYGWNDKDAGTVTIPIGRAMELTVRDLSE